MKVIHFTNNLIDGAGKATYRLHKALINQGIESLMIVAQKHFHDDTVIQVVKDYRIMIDKNIISKKGLFIEGFKFLLFLFHLLYWHLLLFKWRPKKLFNVNHSFISLNTLKKYLNDVDIICFYSVQSFLSSHDINPSKPRRCDNHTAPYLHIASRVTQRALVRLAIIKIDLTLPPMRHAIPH